MRSRSSRYVRSSSAADSATRFGWIRALCSRRSRRSKMPRRPAGCGWVEGSRAGRFDQSRVVDWCSVSQMPWHSSAAASAPASLLKFAVLSRYAFTCAPCWRGASTLSMRQAIYATLHLREVGTIPQNTPAARSLSSRVGLPAGSARSSRTWGCCKMPGWLEDSRLRDRSGHRLKLVAFLILVGASVYVLFFTPAGDLFRTHEGRKLLVARLDAMVQGAGPLGPALFILVYSVGILFLPASPFTIAGAVIFGKFHGMIYNLVADTIGASASFFLGRYLLRGLARDFLETKLPWLDRKAAEEGFSVVFYLRIFWFPFIVLNYAAGATKIRFRDYLLGTVLGLLPPVFIFTYFVGAIRDILAEYQHPYDLLNFHTVFPVLLLVFSFFIPAMVKRLRKDREPSP